MCEDCGKSFASKEYLRHHSNIHTGSRPYKCDECGRGFAQRNSLHQHLKVHTGNHAGSHFFPFHPHSFRINTSSFGRLVRRASLQLQRLRQALHPAQRAPEAPAHSHGREALHVWPLRSHLHGQVHPPPARQGELLRLPLRIDATSVSQKLKNNASSSQTLRFTTRIFPGKPTWWC